MLQKRECNLYTRALRGVMLFFVFVVAFGIAAPSDAARGKPGKEDKACDPYASQNNLLTCVDADGNGPETRIYDWYYEVLLYDADTGDEPVHVDHDDEILFDLSMADASILVHSDAIEECKRVLSDLSIGSVTAAEFHMTSGRLQIHLECWTIRKKGKHEHNWFDEDDCHQHLLPTSQPHENEWEYDTACEL